MAQFLLTILAAFRAFFRTRGDTALEILALRQQVAVLKRKRPRPPLKACDRLFWTTLRRIWPGWAQSPIHCQTRDRGRLASRRLSPVLALASPPRRGRPRITPEVKNLIGRLAQENLDWGAPKIHAELQKLGFTIAERTVARYLRRIVRRGDPKQKWLAFLQNHREVIAALDFFTVPTVTFRVLYGFFAIEHQRRKILHCNVTLHPTAEWIVQQLREAFPEPCRYRYVILDRDRKFDGEVMAFLQAAGLKAKRTSVQAPWQNGGPSSRSQQRMRL
jgi:putative transposase